MSCELQPFWCNDLVQLFLIIFAVAFLPILVYFLPIKPFFKTQLKAPQKEDSKDLLARALIMGDANDAILSQESSGQVSFVESQTLPTDMSKEDAETLKKAGVVFKGIVKNDPIFQYVVLPNGWELSATDHSMWNYLKDQFGRKRASIFYKAASYDRSSHMRCNTRFSISVDYDKLDAGIAVASVHDEGVVTYTTEELTFDESKKRYDMQKIAVGKASAWLQTKYPSWEDTSAYWDLPRPD